MQRGSCCNSNFKNSKLYVSLVNNKQTVEKINIKTIF
jgi:hypothetical protein